MEIKEGDTVILKNGKIATVYSLGLAIGNMLPGLVNLTDGTFCFKDDIERVISNEN